MVSKPIWPNGVFGVPQITPYTTRDAHSLLELIKALRDHIVDELHPNLQAAIDKLVADVEAEYGNALDQYVNGVQEFQRIHDAFMSDVNAHLMALNDGAVSDLVKDDTSLLGQTLREIFTDRQSMDEMIDQWDLFKDATRQQIQDFTQHIEEFTQEQIAQLEATANAVADKLDQTNKYVSYRTFGITGNGDETEKIQRALDTIPEHHVLTFPRDMNITVSNTLTVDRPIEVQGGVFNSSVGRVFAVSHDDVSLSDLTIHPPSGHDTYDRDHVTIEFMGDRLEYLDNVHVSNVHVPTTQHIAIRMEYVNHASITGCKIRHFRYGGIIVNSVNHVLIEENDIRHAINTGAPQSHLGYGIAVSDRENTPAYRSSHVHIHRNRVVDIPTWEGIDTHGGYRIVITDNYVQGCQTGIILTVGNDNRNTAPEMCRVDGNFIDGQYGDYTGTTGIGFGGSWPANPNHPMPADSIIVNNHIVNVTGRHVSYAPSRRSSGAISKERSVVLGNTGDTNKWRIEGETMNSGWVSLTEFGSFRTGYRRGSRPIRGRASLTPNGRRFTISGTIDITNASNRSSTIFAIRDTKYAPPYDMLVGYARTASGAQCTIGVRSNGEVYYSRPVGDISGELVIYVSWETE